MSMPESNKSQGQHLSQIKRYEQSDGEPSMGVIRKFAKSLNVTSDDKQMAKKVIQGLIIQNQTKRWSESA